MKEGTSIIFKSIFSFNIKIKDSPTYMCNGGVANLVSRPLSMRKVPGSKPGISIIFYFYFPSRFLFLFRIPHHIMAGWAGSFWKSVQGEYRVFTEELVIFHLLLILNHIFSFFFSQSSMNRSFLLPGERRLSFRGMNFPGISTFPQRTLKILNNILFSVFLLEIFPWFNDTHLIRGTN
jgi:hypothetical protein